MLEKQCRFGAYMAEVPAVIPLFSPADAVFEKLASPELLPEVAVYIAKLKPERDCQYVLVNAMGASEFYGSNVNGDHFPEAALIHKPDDWSGSPLLDAIKARAWPYGFPTFMNAQVFAHHRNKDPAKGFGPVELAAWNPHMRRVELVTRLERERCLRHGGQAVWDELKAGHYPDVSMGTRVPFDTCSVCLDWERYEEGRARFEPRRHKSPADAILELHRELQQKGGPGIRGLSITRRDYCDHARSMMNRILPDGRKVWVYNDYPKFFDISFVFTGADKTAKSMLKIADKGRVWFDFGRRHVSSSSEALDSKHASAHLRKDAKLKRSEIEKQVVPNELSQKAVPLLTEIEPHLDNETLDLLMIGGLESALAIPSALGIVLRPREFQRVVLTCTGERELAKELDASGRVFPQVSEVEHVSLSPEAFRSALASLLLPMLAQRSAYGPMIEERVLIVRSGRAPRAEACAKPSLCLQKLGALYGGYRKAVLELMPRSRLLLDKLASTRSQDLHSLRSARPEELITPLSLAYLREAFWDETAQVTSRTI